MQRSRGDQQPPSRRHRFPPGKRCPHFRVVLVLIRYPVFSAHQHTRGTRLSPWNRQQEARTPGTRAAGRKFGKFEKIVTSLVPGAYRSGPGTIFSTSKPLSPCACLFMRIFERYRKAPLGPSGQPQRKGTTALSHRLIGSLHNLVTWLSPRSS